MINIYRVPKAAVCFLLLYISCLLGKNETNTITPIMKQQIVFRNIVFISGDLFVKRCI